MSIISTVHSILQSDTEVIFQGILLKTEKSVEYRKVTADNMEPGY